MKIKKAGDGILWIFNESIHGWEKSSLSWFNAGDLLVELIKDKMVERKDLSYGAAFSEVQKENPELAIRYFVEIKGNKGISKGPFAFQEAEIKRGRLEENPAEFFANAVEFEMTYESLSYAEAFAEVKKKYPEMARRFQLQVKGLWPPK